MFRIPKNPSANLTVFLLRAKVEESEDQVCFYDLSKDYFYSVDKEILIHAAPDGDTELIYWSASLVWMISSTHTRTNLLHTFRTRLEAMDCCATHWIEWFNG